MYKSTVSSTEQFGHDATAIGNGGGQNGLVGVSESGAGGYIAPNVFYTLTRPYHTPANKNPSQGPSITSYS